MALALQLALSAIALVRETWGAVGVLVSAALLGLTDVDALTLSMSRLGNAPATVALAAQAIALGILANTLLKLTLTIVFGAPEFRRVASTGLLALAGASAFGLWLGQRW